MEQSEHRILLMMSFDILNISSLIFVLLCNLMNLLKLEKPFLWNYKESISNLLKKKDVPLTSA